MNNSRWPAAQVLLLALTISGFVLCSSRVALGASGTTPCMTDAESRQLDYWVGNWTMPDSSGSGQSTSKVYLSLDQCLFIEHWENSKGHVTEKMFAYSPEDKKWSGMFADNEGRVHVFIDGKVSAGVAEFHGSSRGPNGEAVLHRLKVVRMAGNKLEETWEKSTDNGSNWTSVYRADYSRAHQ